MLLSGDGLAAIATQCSGTPNGRGTNGHAYGPGTRMRSHGRQQCELTKCTTLIIFRVVKVSSSKRLAKQYSLFTMVGAKNSGATQAETCQSTGSGIVEWWQDRPFKSKDKKLRAPRWYDTTTLAWPSSHGLHTLSLVTFGLGISLVILIAQVVCKIKMDSDRESY
jgi:hypothetical protein